MPDFTINGITRTVRAVIFDKDGTLMDFGLLWTAIARRRIVRIVEGVREQGPAVGRTGNGDINQWEDRLEEHLAAATGLRPDGTVDPLGPLATGSRSEELIIAAAMLYRHFGLPFVQALELARHAYAQVDAEDLVKSHTRPLPGVPGILVRMRQAGLLLGIASTDSTANILHCNQLLGVADLISVAVGADRVERGKPHPDMLILAAEALGIPVAEMVMVGDGAVDLQMGRQAGVAFTVGVLTGLANAEQLGPHADLLLGTLAEWPLAEKMEQTAGNNH